MVRYVGCGRNYKYNHNKLLAMLANKFVDRRDRSEGDGATSRLA